MVLNRVVMCNIAIEHGFFMNSMVIFHTYVELPKGIYSFFEE